MQQSCGYTFRLENQALLVSSLRTLPCQNLEWVKKKDPAFVMFISCIPGHCYSAERRTWLGSKGGSQGDGGHHWAADTETDTPQSHWYVLSDGCRSWLSLWLPGGIIAETRIVDMLLFVRTFISSTISLLPHRLWICGEFPSDFLLFHVPCWTHGCLDCKVESVYTLFCMWLCLKL